MDGKSQAGTLLKEIYCETAHRTPKTEGKSTQLQRIFSSDLWTVEHHWILTPNVLKCIEML